MIFVCFPKSYFAIAGGGGWKGFYQTSMSEHVRRGMKTMVNDTAPALKVTLLFGDYIKVNTMFKCNFKYKCHLY